MTSNIHVRTATERTQVGKTPRYVGVTTIAREMGIAPATLSRLIAWHGPTGRHAADPYPKPDITASGTQQWHETRIDEWRQWYKTRSSQQSKDTTPPERLTPQQWSALVTMANHHVTQIHPTGKSGRAYLVSHGIPNLTMGALLVEGLARTVGEQGQMEFVLTAAGEAMLHRHPDWVERASR